MKKKPGQERRTIQERLGPRFAKINDGRTAVAIFSPTLAKKMAEQVRPQKAK